MAAGQVAWVHCRKDDGRPWQWGGGRYRARLNRDLRDRLVRARAGVVSGHVEPDNDVPEESPLLPEDVFTPRQPPERDMFTRRNEPDLHGNPGLQDTLREALRERGGQVILYGDTGVGKSTLLKYAADDEGMPVLSIAATSKRSFDDLVDVAIREVTLERDVEVVRSGTTGGGFEGGVTSHITIRGHLKTRRAKKFASS